MYLDGFAHGVVFNCNYAQSNRQFMTVPKTYEDLMALIAEQVEESTHIEFKRGINKDDGNWRSELAKDISAMANSDGGVIIYGVEEKKIGGLSVADKITPITNIKLETFDQIINTRKNIFFSKTILTSIYNL